MRKLFRDTAPRRWVSPRALAVTICSVMVGPAMGGSHAIQGSPSFDACTGLVLRTVKAHADEPRPPVLPAARGRDSPIACRP